jgi:hypothetical protein
MRTVNIHDLLEEDLGPLVNKTTSLANNCQDAFDYAESFEVLVIEIENLYNKYAELIKDETDGE